MTTQRLDVDHRTLDHDRRRARQRSIRRFVAVSILMAAVVIAATSRTSDAHRRPPHTIDWGDPSVVVDHPGDWTSAVCDPWVPLICVERNGQRVGVVDANSFPVSSFEDPDLATTNPRRFLRRLAAALTPSESEPVHDECGPEFVLEPSEIRNRRVFGHDGIVFGYRGHFEGRPIADVAIIYAAVVGDEVMLVTALAHDAEGCFDGESTFSVADLDGYERRLRSLVRTMPPPMFISEGRP